ncbi:MAG: EthD domain-containing protein [Novosphingobium sp.]|nr:EthD domain-containing protein [Novosphingobium sp.]
MSGCKVIALLRKRDDLLREAFVDYYESRHAPLILASFPSIVAYRRNYSDFTDAFASAASPFDFDVVTEIHFADRAGYDDMLARHAQPAIAEAIAADEANFLDRARTRMFVVEPRESAVTREHEI